MAKITKFAQNIFGSQSSADQIAQFGSKAAGTPAFTTSPSTAQSLSQYLAGWFSAVIEGAAPCIEDLNALHFVETSQLAYLVQSGVAEWDAVTTYYIGSIVNVAGVLFVSITDDNQDNLVTDPSNWLPYSTNPVGSGMDYWGPTAPAGYVFADGLTIGNATSNATGLASAACLNLFTLLWNNYSNTLLPIFNSDGSSGSRGSNASADWSANKAISLIDKRGRASFAADNMGGSAANRLTSATMNPDGETLGASGGSQTHSLTIGELATHSHILTDPGHTHTWTNTNNAQGLTGSGSDGPDPDGASAYEAISGSNSTNATGITMANTGSGTAHLTVPPAIVCNYILKL